jgi:transposase
LYRFLTEILRMTQHKIARLKEPPLAKQAGIQDFIKNTQPLVPISNLVVFDEVGFSIEQDGLRTCGWAEVGARLYLPEAGPGASRHVSALGYCHWKGTRLPSASFPRFPFSSAHKMLDHQTQTGWVACGREQLVEGSVSSAVVLRNFSDVIFPRLPQHPVLVLDNASVHKSNRAWLERILAVKGGYLLFLPPYSPQLSPIEVLFSLVKRKLREIQPSPRDLDDNIVYAFASVDREIFARVFRYCGWTRQPQ